MTLVIAVISARSERRHAIRQTWLAWGDERVELRFFTEVPEVGSPEEASLREESAAHGDLVLMDIDPGMNFALKLVSAIRWMSTEFTFDFFLRLDDDYFLCLKRLLDELEETLAEVEHPPAIFGGKVLCNVLKMRRIDEAYLLLSAKLVRRILETPDLQCGSDAGVTASWWFAKGNQLNQLGDVEWVNDPRLDHQVGFANLRQTYGGDICVEHMGVHRQYPEAMLNIWEAAKDKPGPALGETLSGNSILSYVYDGTCKEHPRVSDDIFRNKRFNGQSCDTFTTTGTKIWCGQQGC